MTIGPLPQQDTIKYLRKRFAESGIVLNAAMAKYMISATSDIPHYIQLLAAETWQYMVNSRKLVTKKIIDNCIARMIAFKSDYYMELFDRQSQSQKQLLQALTVEGKNIFSTAYIHAHRLPSASTLQRAVNKLINEGVIEKANDEYFIADPFFKRFIVSIS